MNFLTTLNPFFFDCHLQVYEGGKTALCASCRGCTEILFGRTRQVSILPWYTGETFILEKKMDLNKDCPLVTEGRIGGGGRERERSEVGWGGGGGGGGRLSPCSLVLK